VPVAATVNVAVCPAVTVWFAGCVVIAGAVDVPLAVKLTPVRLVVLTDTFWFAGVNVYVALVGVIA